jgi:uncharacterized protein (TIGR03067 family)
MRVSLLLLTGLLVGSYGPAKGDEKKATKGLEGTWVVVSFTRDGKTDDKTKGDKLVFEGNTVTINTKAGPRKATFKIDPKKQTLDITVTEQGQQRSVKAIYQIKGDELKVCHGRPGEARPKELTGAKGSGKVLVVLKRAKSK